MKVSKLQDIEVYTQSLVLAQGVYAPTKNTKLNKEYSICDQMKRASLSVSANIAEGYGRKTKQDFAHFITMALGSCNELVAFFDFTKLEFKIDSDSIKSDYEVLSKRIYTFRSYLISRITSLTSRNSLCSFPNLQDYILQAKCERHYCET